MAKFSAAGVYIDETKPNPQEENSASGANEIGWKLPGPPFQRRPGKCGSRVEPNPSHERASLGFRWLELVGVSSLSSLLLSRERYERPATI
jgi:hypothetical protein